MIDAIREDTVRMIFLAQVKDPVKALMELDAADNKRKMF